MAPLGISEILALLVNTLTVHRKYSLHNCENFRQPNKMQLSKERKAFREILHF